MTLQERIYRVARAFEGANEFVGETANPFLVKIIKWALPWVSGVRIDKEYSYCGIFQAWVLKAIGKEHLAPDKFWGARQWLKIGDKIPLSEAKIGDYVIFWRGDKNGWKGHVSQLAENKISDAYVLVYGANQSNEIRESKYHSERILGVRRLSGRDISIKAFSRKSRLTRYLLKII